MAYAREKQRLIIKPSKREEAITSSRISLFRCSDSGKSLIILSNALTPPCRFISFDFSIIDGGICRPPLSSIAAGKLTEARKLNNTSETNPHLKETHELRTLVASRRRLISIFIISARLELNAARALFNAIGTNETNRSKSNPD